jgi:hypothetical protein
LLAKLEPFMVSVIVVLLDAGAWRVVGANEVIDGTMTMLRVCGAVVPPPGAGLLTVIWPVPAVPRSVALSVTMREVALT